MTYSHISSRFVQYMVHAMTFYRSSSLIYGQYVLVCCIA